MIDYLSNLSHPDTGETELKEVVQTFVRETSELVHIKVNGEEIITTPTHPFWVPQKGWTDAIQLRAGDRLQLLNGEYVIIEQVQHELLETPITVYNFEVEDFHTYYVTDSAILVHNKCRAGNAKYYSEYSSRNAAFRAAKRDMGIPMSQQPMSVSPNMNKSGKKVPGRTYTFKSGNDLFVLRDDAAGHVEWGIGPHINIKGSKWHYLYP